MITILAQLVAKSSDIDNYITYVFVDLASKEYLMCVQFPNWEHRELRLGEIGYLEYKEIRAGVDKWYDGTNFIPYNYSNIQFIKFITKPSEKEYCAYL